MRNRKVKFLTSYRRTELRNWYNLAGKKDYYFKIACILGNDKEKGLKDNYDYGKYQPWNGNIKGVKEEFL